MSDLLYLFSSFVTQIVYTIIFGKLVSKKIKWNAFLILLYIIVAGILVYSEKVLVQPITVILSIVYFIILFKTIYKVKYNEAIYKTIFIWCIAIVFDFIIMLLMGVMNIENLTNGFDINYLKGICTLSYQLFLYLIMSQKKIIKLFQKLYEILIQNQFYIKTMILLGIIILCGTLCSLNLEKVSYNLIVFLILIVVLILFIFYVVNEYNIYTLKEMNQFLIKNNEFYLTMVNDYKIMRHNIINQLIGVKSVSNKKSRELIDDLIKEYNQSFQGVQGMQKIPVGINGIVYEKIYNHNCEDLNLGIENNIESTIMDNLTARSYNLLCESLGIILDNALEATSESHEKIIAINLSETEDTYKIKIVNTFSNFLDLEALGNLNYTNKKSGHGIGLFSIMGRKKIKVKNTIVNNHFHSEIIVEKKKK